MQFYIYSREIIMKIKIYFVLLTTLFLAWCEKDRTNEWLYTQNQCIKAWWSIWYKLKLMDNMNDSGFSQKLVSWNVNFTITCNEDTQIVIWKIIYEKWTIDGWVCCK